MTTSRADAKTGSKNRRILILDDNQAIHEDIRKSLSPIRAATPELDAMEALLFGDEVQEAHPSPSFHFEITSAYQGEEGLDIVRQSVRENAPFALAFIDVRIPPGWDGIESLARIWEEDPALQAVICSAYSDYSWEALVKRLPKVDGFMILKKPFDSAEVRQMAYAMTEKWNAHADIVAAYSTLRKSEANQRAQAEALAELSMPFIPINERVAVMPLIGDMDGKRVERIRETLVQRLAERKVNAAIVDLTGIGLIDSAAVEELLRTVRAVRLLGTELILTGVRAAVARHLVDLGADMSGVCVRQTLQNGIELGMRR